MASMMRIEMRWDVFYVGQLDPVTRIFQNLHELFFACSGPFPAQGGHVFPSRRFRQRHQDTLYPRAGGVQPKLGTSIIDQVELDIPPSPELLPPLLLGRPAVVHVLVDDGHVGGEEGGGSGFYKFENLFSAWSLGAVRRGMDGGRGGEIVKEDAAETSALAAVGDGEIPVALLLKVGPVALVVLVAGVLERLVEMDGVGLVEVGRGEVGPAAKPPRFRFPGLGIFNLKVPVVEMDGGHVWVPGVDDDAEAGCEEGDGAGGLRQARVVRQHGHLGLGRELAVHDGDVDAGLFKDASVGEDAGGAFAAFGADPGVAEKGGRGGRRGELVGRGGGLDLFHRADDVVLQRLDPRGHADAHRVLRGVSDGAESGGLPLGRRFRGRRRGATGARASRWRRRRARRRSGRCPGRCEQLRETDRKSVV